MALDIVIAGRIRVGFREHQDWGWLGTSLRTGSMDPINVVCPGELLGDGVGLLACPTVSLGLTEPVEMDRGVALINLSNRSTGGGGGGGCGSLTFCQ